MKAQHVQGQLQWLKRLVTTDVYRSERQYYSRHVLYLVGQVAVEYTYGLRNDLTLQIFIMHEIVGKFQLVYNAL